MENRTEVTHFILLGLTNDPGLQVPLFITFLLTYTITLVGNLGMILLILLESRLHTPMYFFLGNMSLVDFCYSSSVTPTFITGLLTGDKIISYNASASQILFLDILALWKISCWLQWPIFCIGLYTILPPWQHMCVQGWSQAAIFMPASISFFALLVILMSYMLIFIIILKMHSGGGHQKAMSTCASRFAAVSIFYGTLLFMYLQPTSSHSMDTDKIASVFYIMIIPMLNPLVYSLRNKEVKSLQRLF
uniref:G-protein coupled receptors family 1 profile domain-containing protein n=1 Tax=Nannospalax galili TaxID=1026970 RepID=A0A8C6QFA0_NANGA